MTRTDWEQLDHTIAKMTAGDKRHLIERLTRALNGDRTADTNKMLPEQRQALLDFLDEMDALPLENADDTSTGRRHDEVLYGWHKS